MFAAVSWWMNGKGGAGLSRKLREARKTVKHWGTFKGYQQVQDCQRAGKEREAGLKNGQGLMRAIWAMLKSLGRNLLFLHHVFLKNGLKCFLVSLFYSTVSFKKIFFKLKDSCLTVLCWPLSYINIPLQFLSEKSVLLFHAGLSWRAACTVLAVSYPVSSTSMKSPSGTLHCWNSSCRL